MAVKVIGGIVAQRTDATNKATVIEINFADANRDVNGRVPAGSIGTLLLKDVPDKSNFVSKDILDYFDSNQNNNASLTVDKVVGPTKFTVIMR